MDTYGFDTRLRHLEHIVGSEKLGPDDATLVHQTHTLNKELQALYKANKHLQEFQQKYEPYHKLLNPTQSSLELERELLQPETKLELVLAAHDDMEQLAKTLQQVKQLEHVVNSKDYQHVDQLARELAPLEVAHSEQCHSLGKVTSDISSTMNQYNKLINTLSEIFIAWDDLLSSMEQHVSALEKGNAVI
ncbi:hypothetical protein BC940DRAFT_293795 [Gongronella butleri]|nr:hypothetical protein BC940DRAFT_293795 [Gongronella butleri]